MESEEMTTFLLRLPKDLMEKIKLMAESERRSCNNQILHFLAGSIDERRSLERPAPCNAADHIQLRELHNP